MICDDCGNDLVEVDNPMRREVRHRRGVVCTPLTAEQREKRDEILRHMVLIDRRALPRFELSLAPLGDGDAV